MVTGDEDNVAMRPGKPAEAAARDAIVARTMVLATGLQSTSLLT